jgi:hypothetical protein
MCQNGRMTGTAMTGWRAARGVVLVLGLLCGGLAGPSWAVGRAALEEVVELKDVAMLATLCREVRLPAPLETTAGARDVEHKLANLSKTGERQAALERIYTLILPSDRFDFADYDVDTHKLTVATQGGFHTMQGALGLWSTDHEPLEIPLEVSAAQALLKAKKAGRLGLRLYVHLDADPEDTDVDSLRGEPCATRPGTQSYALAVTWLGGELLDTGTGTSLARFATEKGRETPKVAHLLLGNAALRIGAPEGAGDSAGAVLAALEGRKDVLHACHEKHGRHAEGGVVLGLDVGKGGVVEKVGVDINSLEGDAVGRCVASEVKAARLTAKVPAGTHVTVPLVWGRE